jgi:Spy/CpxP family protein refolding chaperone
MAKRVVIQAGPSPFMMLLGAAKLTPAQRTQVQQILQSKSADTDALMAQLHAVEEQISDRLLSPGPVNASDLAPLEKQATDIKQKMDQNMVDTSLAIRNVLTHDQLKRLVEVRKQLENLRAQIQTLMGAPPLPGMPMP